VRWNAFFAFVVTFGEALLTLVLVRFVWRLLKRAWTWARQGTNGRRAQAA
jgi:HAE1 family hydrophobic/amphiphilic exporter-1